MATGALGLPFAAGLAGGPLGGVLGAGINLLGGLFGRRRGPPSAGDNVLSQAGGIRQAQEQHGFNPLALLGMSHAQGGGAPPGLASNELLMGSLRDVTDLVSGETARRNAANQLELDLGKLKLEQMRSGVQAVGIGPSPFGVNTTRVIQPATTYRKPSYGAPDQTVGYPLPAGSGPRPLDGGAGLRPLEAPSPVDRRRDVYDEPVKTHPGVMTVDNPNLPFPLYAPTLDGDEALQWYEYPSLIVPALTGAGVAFDKAYPDGPYMGESISVQRTEPPTGEQTRRLKRMQEKRRFDPSDARPPRHRRYDQSPFNF